MSKINDKLIDKEIEEPVREYEFIDDGKEHLHKYCDKPLYGTSTVVGVLAKPLTWWASGLAVEKFGWINSKKKIDGKYVTVNNDERLAKIEPKLQEIQKMSNSEFLALCDEAYKAHSVKLNDSADAGTDLHAELEKYVLFCIMNNNGVPAISESVTQFSDWAIDNVEKFILSEKNVYSTKMWTGGKFDVIFLMKNGKTILGDFKSSKEAYLSHFIQIAGYDLQQEENGIFNDKGYKLSGTIKIDGYCVFPFGSDRPFDDAVDMRFNTEELREGFKSCVTLYKLQNQ